MSVICIKLAKPTSNDSDGNMMFKNNVFNETTSESTTEKINVVFDAFKSTFNKSYNTSENEMRKTNFLKSIDFIAKHNQLFLNGTVSHGLAPNKFIDLSDDELSTIIRQQNIRKNFNLQNSVPRKQGIVYDVDSCVLPLEFDWRVLGKVTKAKDQMSCNCCYAFTVVATIESAIAIHRNLSAHPRDDTDAPSIDLSEQQIVDCSASAKYHNNGCQYGYIDDTYQYVMDRGVVTEADYPYIEAKSVCLDEIQTNRTYIAKFNHLSHPGINQIKDVIYRSGPVIALINNDGLDFIFYNRGIIKTPDKSHRERNYNHAVVIVGWGLHNGTEYWIVKNSWSQDWGYNGFAMIEFGVRGINDYIYYPILDDTDDKNFNHTLIIVMWMKNANTLSESNLLNKSPLPQFNPTPGSLINTRIDETNDNNTVFPTTIGIFTTIIPMNNSITDEDLCCYETSVGSVGHISDDLPPNYEQIHQNNDRLPTYEEITQNV
ncbi:unnamed protein product [Oppiella nova]|uniref:Peptidase C1A papain C-terminal domain-containing protein n=1 Tax=Oppiella nova TaxID=334625 RepID=A0A7R9QJV8_9ACAR|nr:unnamed protein product [Oppiella nova]CAG2166756.1 unnamed protein product [Oppiella nova]